MTILLPLVLTLVTSGGSSKRTKALPTDKYVVAYCLVVFALSFRATTLTNSFRTLFNILVDVALPYFAVTRSVVNRDAFIKVFAAIVASGAAMALVGSFEAVKKWLLYKVLAAWPGGKTTSGYDIRAGFQRAGTTFASPIVFALYQMICLGGLLALKGNHKFSREHLALVGLFLLGLLLSFSRGPWIAAAAMVLIYAYLGRNSIRSLAPLLVGAGIVFLIMSMTSVGQKILEFLPFFGSSRDDTITYRQELLANGLDVFWRTPFFGSATFIDTQELQSMRNGQGLIDIVNTYLGQGLNFGFAGLIPFVGVQVSALWQLWRTMRYSRRLDPAWHQIHRVVFAMIIGIMIEIGTASSIDRTLQYYWCFAGLACASCIAFRLEHAKAKKRERLPLEALLSQTQ